MILKEIHASGTGGKNTGATITTTGISSQETTVAHAVADATAIPPTSTAVAFKKTEPETQRPYTHQDVLLANAGTMTSWTTNIIMI